MKSKNKHFIYFSLIFIDTFSLVSSFIVNYYFKFHEILWYRHIEWNIFLLLICIINLFVIYLIDPYKNILYKAFNKMGLDCIFITIYCFLFLTAILYLFKSGQLFSRELIMRMYILYFIISYILKYKCKIYFEKYDKKIRLYIICEKDKENEIINSIMSEDISSYEIVGISTDINFISDLLAKKAQKVLISIDPSLIDKEVYSVLNRSEIEIHIDIEATIGFTFENKSLSKIGVYNTLNVGVYSFTRLQKIYLYVKRFLDILLSMICLIPFTILVLIVKLIYIMSGDTNKIIYTQNRIGKNGKVIKIFKFRSMVPNADDILFDLLKNDKYRKEWEKNQKFENDPRVTKFGHLLRKTSLDEIPQIINVLKGEMSFIGPRPLVAGELEAHGGLNIYNKVKPGITGWWGCNGRSNIQYRERLELEYYYIKNISLFLDIVCIARTIKAIIVREGSK